jgi:Ca2+-binding EF-hand superfamily protein
MNAIISEFRKEYLIALGRITVNMNHLEMWTRVYLGQLMDCDSEFVRKRYPTERYGKILEVFDLTFHVKISDEKLREEFSLILSNLSSLYQKRNTYIHSLWLFAEDDSFVIRTKDLKYPNTEQDREPTPSELNQLADDIGTAIGVLSKFINRVAPFKKSATT